MTDMSGERRRYFRIDDHVRLNYKVITDLKHLPGHATEEVILPNEVLLQDLDIEFNNSLNALWQEHPLAAKALAQLNRKIDLLSLGEDKGGVAATALASDPMPVNISGCGIAFRVGEQMPEGQLLDLQITLLPSETQLRLMARVISVDVIPGSDETDTKPYLLRAEFAGKESDAREMLISHIVQRQHAMLSEEKDASESEVDEDPAAGEKHELALEELEPDALELEPLDPDK